jgi:putative membrane protein
MGTLIRWRIAARSGKPIDTRHAPAFARISAAQAVLVVIMVLAATALARGYGTRTP